MSWEGSTCEEAPIKKAQVDAYLRRESQILKEEVKEGAAGAGPNENVNKKECEAKVTLCQFFSQ